MAPHTSALLPVMNTAPEVKQPVLGAKRVQMVCDLPQLRFPALLYFKQKSVFSPSVRQKANPAISYWAGSPRS